ncbi:MAG: nucleotidyltransferase family protein, partial [Clostridia bacterium]
LLCALKCKRYTYARLSRVVAQSLLGITQSLCTAYPRAPYVRLLGLGRTGVSLCPAISHASAGPFLTRAADCRTACPPLFALEARAGDLWSLGCMHPDARKGLSDYTAPFLRI